MSVKVITGTPVNIKDIDILDVCTTTYTTQINKKSLMQSIFGNKGDLSFADGINELKSLTESLGGNIIFDIKVSTATATFNNGTYLYTTLIASVGKE
ncbi:hypothetical protein DPV87_04300 [Haemophilus parainfluenzae]|uniref:Heavy metal-binding domain-containing protein n=1 Tax=Haemophilus parainfluenzae TaxID=729 RepID=A0A369Z0T6_HAEPA|nr:hypothetical protein [Haemophilus parainfluenzae]RDE92601.1 hypothetical protein DPV87_04300 [Haemophilus parainfluenzae]